VEKRIRLFFALFLVFVIFFSFATELSERHGGFFSDESGYYSIIQSLAYDGDIKYERKDLFRIKRYFPAGPVGFFLKKGADGQLYYAKSFAYPMLAAPFFRIFSHHGLLIFNGLMLFFSILMAFQLLSQYHPQPRSFGFALAFILASVTPVYIWWMTADLFNFFVLFTGLFFFFYKFRGFKNEWPFYLSAVFFSLSVFSKPFNVVAIAIIYLILLYRKEWKRFILMSLISVVVFGVFVLYLFLQTGQLNYKLFQGGERRSFITEFPYQTSEPMEKVFERGHNMSFDGYWQRFFTSPHVIASNIFYYFFGRFTGMFIYFFPACFVLLLFFFQRKVPEDWFVLAAIVASSLIFSMMAPDNYFGGSGSVGNRYFLNIFPLFFFLGFKNRNLKFTVVPVLMSLMFLSGVYTDSLHHSISPRAAGLSFPIRLFPPEKTQYLSLPTNENPRAFGKMVHDGDRYCQIYILNDNFHDMAKNGFVWTKKDRQLEFFVAAPEKVKRFRVTLQSAVKDNEVSVEAEYKRKRVILSANRPYVAEFKDINGLKMKNKYLYYFKIKSERWWVGLNDEGEIDHRGLGVNFHIGLDY
jgi:hypothetical protein